MKKVNLREINIPYAVTVADTIAANESVILERNGQPIAALIPIAEYEAFQAWRTVAEASSTDEPALTADGDQEALMAVARIGSMFPPVDAETARYIAESAELTLDYNLLLNDEELHADC
jgi:hypothetical protein